MSSIAKDARQDARVAITKLAEPDYSQAVAQAAITRGATELGLAEEERGPLAGVIPAGARVLIKPNFVMHENQGPWGIEPLVTHPAIIRATVIAELIARANRYTFQVHCDLAPESAGYKRASLVLAIERVFERALHKARTGVAVSARRRPARAVVWQKLLIAIYSNQVL